MKLLAKAHPDYKLASQELRAIFGLLKIPDGYPEPGNFIAALLAWNDKFSHPQVHAGGNNEKIQKLAGKS